MSAALGLAAGGVLPLDCAAYDAVWSFIMPLAAALFMLESDLTRWARAARRAPPPWHLHLARSTCHCRPARGMAMARPGPRA
jgi:hypothetical protein